MELLRKSALNVVGALVLYGLASYLPLAYLLSWWQYEEAKDWESRTCSVSCGYKNERGKHGSSGTVTTLSYRVEPRRVEQIVRPTVDESSKYDLKPTNSVDEFRRKRKENLEGINQISKDQDERREQEAKLREEDKKYLAFTHHNYRIFNLGGWNYWPNSGINAFCSDHDTSSANWPGLETECYVNPKDPGQAALNRDFELGWINRSLLILSLCALFGLVYLEFKGFRKKSRPRE